jgi:hypothetical protein
MTYYNESFLTYCENGYIDKVRNICAISEASFEMIQQGIDVAIRKNNMHMLFSVLAIPKKIAPKLINYMANNNMVYYINDVLDYGKNIQKLARILYACLLSNNHLVIYNLNKYLNDTLYLDLRRITLQIYNDERFYVYNNEIPPDVYKDIYNAIMLLTKDVDISKMYHICDCVNLIVYDNCTPVSDMIKLIEQCRYAALLPEAQKRINKIKTEISYIRDYISNDALTIVFDYIYYKK